MRKTVLFILGIVIPFFPRAQHDVDTTDLHFIHKGEVSVMTNFDLGSETSQFVSPSTWGFRRFENWMVRFGHSFGEQSGTEINGGYPIVTGENCWFSPNIGFLKNTNSSKMSILTGNFLAFDIHRFAGVSIIQYSFGTDELFTLNEGFYHFPLKRKGLTVSPGFMFEGLLYKKRVTSENETTIVHGNTRQLFLGPLIRTYFDGFFMETGIIFSKNVSRITFGVGHTF